MYPFRSYFRANMLVQGRISCNHFSTDRKRVIGNNFVANVLDFKRLMSSPVHVSSVALFTYILTKKLKLSM